jgi:hypothetical protein
LNTGRWVSQTFQNIPKNEHFIDVNNGSPGLTHLSVGINGRPYLSGNLQDDQTLHRDATALMNLEKNSITFVGQGETGSFANIAVSDIAPALHSENTRPAQFWGPLVGSLEDNSLGQTASSSTQQIHLNFATSLIPNLAGTDSYYQVMVNGSRVSGQRVTVLPGTQGTTVVLTLGGGSFVAGDAIDVNWNGLRNTAGHPVSGHVELTAQ